MIGAIFAAVASFAKWAFTASTFAAFAVRTAIIMGGSYLLNRALATSVSDAESSDSYVFSPQTTESQGIAVQNHYGDNRIGANIVGHYTVIGDGLVSNNNISRNILACFGEGPIEEPDDESVRINGRPLSDFSGVTTQWRLGTVDQTVLDAWTVFRQDYNVGQTALSGDPITMTLPRTGFDDIEVHLKLPNGLIHYGTDGDTHTELLAYKIEVGDAIGDTWQTLVQTTIGGRTAATCWLRYTASGSYPGGTPFAMTSLMQPRVRVTKLSGDSANPRHIHDIEFAAVQVVKNIAFTHPGMVLLNLGLVPTEATTGGVSEVSVESTGRIVADENGDFATSRYHADAIRDILTQPVIEGDGSPEAPWTANYYRGVDPDRLVDDGFTAQKTLADKLVPDGNGNDVPMLRCDAVFSGATSVYTAVGKVGASGRCGLDYRGRLFGLWIESTRYPVGILCDGNCERGSISLTPIQNDQLASEASVRYRDAAASYDERTILVIDHQFDTLTTVNLDLAVATRTHEVSRLARRELARNRLVDLSASCRSDVDAAVYEAGDVVYVQIDGRSQGGRVTAVSATGVVLDRSIEEIYTADDALIVQTRNPSTAIQALEIKAVATVGPDGKTITIDGAWTITPRVGDAFLFGPSEMIEDDQFEVTDASADEHLHTAPSLVRYVPALDDLDDLPPDTPIPVGIMQRVNHYSGIVRSPLPSVTIDAIGTKPKVAFDWGNYTFAAGDPGEITWSSDTDDYEEASGFVHHNGTLHQPADSATGTSDTWVYWDPASPSVFLTTNDLTDVVGKYLIAKNDNGTPITGFGCIPLDYTSTVWDKITGDGKPEDNADVTADHQGDVNIDNVADGSSYKKLSAANALALESAIDLDTPQPRDGWEGAFTNNSPTAGYVAWVSFKIRWQGGDWTIAAGNTAYKYLYWNAGATKTQLYSSNAIGDAIGTNKFIIGVNDAGVFYPAQFLKILHGALIQAATILAAHISVEDLSAIAAVFSANLGGTYRLRIDGNGIYGSDNSGSTWNPIIEQRDSGVKLSVNLVETDMLVDGAVNNIDSASVSSNLDFGMAEVTAATVSNFAAGGGLVHLSARAQLQSEAYAADIVTMHLYRNTTEVAWKTVNVSQSPAWEPGELDWYDSPSAGTYTYYLKVEAAYGSCNAQNRQLIVQEALK